jgi:hypothetical protein
MHILATVKAALHSSYKIDMQMNPFEYICSLFYYIIGGRGGRGRVLNFTDQAFYPEIPPFFKN